MIQSKKNLILAQKQAYQGAKYFYYGVLPFFIVILITIDLWQGIKCPLLCVLSVLLYLLSNKFYVLCNKIDTYQPLKSDNLQKNIMLDQKIDQSQTSLSNIHDNINNQQSNKPPKFFCKICKILLPYRSHHCYKCRRCVKRYDHHCFWIGNCVGAKNHRQFYTFLLVQSLLNITMEQFIRQKHYWMDDRSLIFKIGLLFTWLLSLGFIMFTMYLFLYHTMLIVTGMTTWQHLRRKQISYLRYLPNGYNPFSKGIFINLKTFMDKSIQQQDYDIPTFEEANKITPRFSIIQNQYYSCC